MIIRPIKEHPKLFALLFIVPLILWILVDSGFWGYELEHVGSELELMKYHVILFGLPPHLSLLMEGLILGCVHGFISIFVACLVFYLFPNKVYLNNNAALYAFCYLIPYCGAAQFCWSESMFGTDQPVLPTLIQEAIRVWEASLSGGLFGSIAGIITFALTQIPWFQRKPLLSSLILFFAFTFIGIVDQWLRGFWLSTMGFTSGREHQFPVAPHVLTSYIEGYCTSLIGTLIILISVSIGTPLTAALFFKGIISWAKGRKQMSQS